MIVAIASALVAVALVVVALCWRSIRLVESAARVQVQRLAVETDLGAMVKAAVVAELEEQREQLGRLEQDVADARSRAAMRGR